MVSFSVNVADKINLLNYFKSENKSVGVEWKIIG